MAEVDKETFDVSREALGIESDEPKKDDKVVQGEVVVKRKGKAQKVAETFFGGDLRDVASYVVMDVLVPNAKDMLYDMVSQGFSRLLFGEVRQRSTSRSRSYTSYSSMSTSRTSRRYDEPKPRGNDFDDITFRDRRDAEAVLDTLRDSLDRYGQCSVAELLKAAGITPKYTDYDIGWSNLSRVSISRYRDGYVLNMPRVEDLR